MIALTGCGGNGSDNKPTASTGTTDRAALIEAAKCMRANGFPDYPDPVETNGRWAFPASATQMAPKPAPACEDLFSRAGALPRRTQRVVSGDEMTKLRKWADCMRANGLPEWPDPDGDGVFHPQPQSIPMDQDPRWQKADVACRSLEPGPISVDAGDNARKGGG